MKLLPANHAAAKPWPLAGFMVLACMIMYLFGDGLYCLARQWVRMGEYWRFLIPPFSLFIVWMNRESLRSAPGGKGYLIGSISLLCGSAFYIAWKISFLDVLVEISLIFLAIGLSFLLLGRQRGKILLIPILYTLFATSLATRALESISPLLQASSAVCAAFLLNTLGWPVMLRGLLIRLPTTVLEVASACSGVNQLTALLAFAIPFALIRHRQWWVRIVVIGACLPIGIVFNSVRIFLIALWNYSAVQASLHGPHDIFLIPVIYPFALASLWLLSVLLDKFDKNTEVENKMLYTKAPHSWMPKTPGLILGLGILFATIATALVFSARPVMLRNDVAVFPQQFGSWHCAKVPPICPTFDFGKPDKILARVYEDSQGNRVNVYVGYFESQNTTKRLAGVGLGSIKIAEKTDSISITGAGPGLVDKAVYSKNDFRLCTLSWYSLQGKDIADPQKVKRASARQMLESRTNNGAFIAVSGIRKEESMVDSELQDFTILKRFLVVAFPDIKRYLDTGSNKVRS